MHRKIEAPAVPRPAWYRLVIYSMVFPYSDEAYLMCLAEQYGRRKLRLVVRATAYHDDDETEYGRSGYIVVQDEDTGEVFVILASHHSNEGSLEVASEREATFVGSAERFYEHFVLRRCDPAMPERLMLPQDYYYKETMRLYAAFAAWHATLPSVPSVPSVPSAAVAAAPPVTPSAQGGVEGVAEAPAHLIDFDSRKRRILRLPRVYASVHGVHADELTPGQLSRLGRAVAAAVPPRGKTEVFTPDGQLISINLYEPDQYGAIAEAVRAMGRC